MGITTIPTEKTQEERLARAGRLEEAVADAEKVLMDPTERFWRRITVADDSAVR